MNGGDTTSVLHPQAEPSLTELCPSPASISLTAASGASTCSPGWGKAPLVLFILGMAAVNTLVCVVLARLLLSGNKFTSVQRWLSGITAAYSFVVGLFFLGGWSQILPTLVHS